MRVRKRIIVKGIVQGVGFRWFAQRHARLLGLGGFVKNLPDGTVFIEVEGSEDLVDAFVEKVKIGPSHAVVEEIVIENVSPIGENIFRIKY